MTTKSHRLSTHSSAFYAHVDLASYIGLPIVPVTAPTPRHQLTVRACEWCERLLMQDANEVMTIDPSGTGSSHAVVCRECQYLADLAEDAALCDEPYDDGQRDFPCGTYADLSGLEGE